MTQWSARGEKVDQIESSELALHYIYTHILSCVIGFSYGNKWFSESVTLINACLRQNIIGQANSRRCVCVTQLQKSATVVLIFIAFTEHHSRTHTLPTVHPSDALDVQQWQNTSLNIGNVLLLLSLHTLVSIAIVGLSAPVDLFSNSHLFPISLNGMSAYINVCVCVCMFNKGALC